jgi:hypothetical protein
MAEELSPQLERVCIGHSVDWNGRNHIGVLDNDADCARTEIHEHLSSTMHSPDELYPELDGNREMFEAFSENAGTESTEAEHAPAVEASNIREGE